MATTISKRVTSAVSTDFSRRVAIGSHGSIYDTWAGSFGASWGLTWHNFLSASELSGNITQRVASGSTPSITKRVTI